MYLTQWPYGWQKQVSSADKDPTEFRRCNVAQCGKFYHVR
jgi:DNA-directed RNA polymerase subunit M/transcription elongation factor TFIIS